MTLKRTFRFRGVKGLRRSLKQLPDQMRETALKNASAAGARIIRDEAKSLVPVDTGHLRDNIVVSRTFKRRAGAGGRRRRIVRLRGAVILGIKGTARYYAHLVEFGTSRTNAQPFMRPALDRGAERAVKAMAEKLGKEIARLAKKLSGWKSMKQIRRLTR